MSEKIYKLQPNRTMALRGFDSLGASAALHSATANSFQVSGNFRDAADFAVAVLWDADNFYEHPRLKYLPDMEFGGLTLSFDVTYSAGLQPLDSPKFNWIDWATLDCVLENGLAVKATLWDYCTLAGGDFSAASGTFHLVSDGPPQPYDRVTLVFGDQAYDYIVPPQTAEFSFFAGNGTGTVHSITVNGRVYPHTEGNPLGENSADQANALVMAINAGAGDSQVTAAIGSVPYAVAVTVRPGLGGAVVPISATDGNAPVTLGNPTIADIAAALAIEISGSNWWLINPTHALKAAAGPSSVTVTAARYGLVNTAGTTVTWAGGAKFTGLAAGAVITIAKVDYTVAAVADPKTLTVMKDAGQQVNAQYVAERGGVDGNLIALYSLHKTTASSLRCQENTLTLAGGSSAATWHCSLDFSLLGAARLRQCWFTYAPPLANGARFAGTEWTATYANWTVDGPENTKLLRVAGPNSVRVEDGDAACVYTGAWASGKASAPETGFYSGGLARRAGSPDGATYESVTVPYACAQTHDLYLGTSLSADRVSAVGVSLDGGGEFTLNCRVGNPSDPQVNTRRLVVSGVAAGTHRVTITVRSAGYFYFDFIEAAVVTDVPDAPTEKAAISPALDYSTDHSYKLPPARVMWIMDMLGLTGPVNQYIGVFWYNQRVNPTAQFPSLTAAFGGTWAAGDVATLTIGANSDGVGNVLNNAVGTVLTKTVGALDTLASIAAHFVPYLNEGSVGLWASSSGSVLTITSRSPQYVFTFAKQVASPAGTIAVAGTLLSGPGGVWVSDPVQFPYVSVRFGGSLAVGDKATFTLGAGTVLTKRAVAGETPVSLASYFASAVNSGGLGLQALVSGSLLTIVPTLPTYVFPFASSLVSLAGTMTVTQPTSNMGTWVVDPTQSPALNRGARDWHADLYAECKSRGREVTTSGSMELVNPPPGYAAVFPDGKPVATDVGFGNLISTHCAQSSGMLGYQKSMFDCLTDLQNAAGLVPNVQFGEYLWWFFTNYSAANPGGGMAFWDAETAAAAQMALRRPLHRFLDPNDDPSVNGGDDAVFLRNRLRDHVASLVAHVKARYPAAQCEVLFAYDVNYPTPQGGVGGRLNNFINFPVEWGSKTAAGYDRLKVEALSFAGSQRNLDLALTAIQFAFAQNWPTAALRYLAPVFIQSSTWQKEVQMAVAMNYPVVNLWAFDQVNIFGLDVVGAISQGRSAGFAL